MAELSAESGGVSEFNQLIATDDQKYDADSSSEHEKEQFFAVSPATY